MCTSWSDLLDELIRERWNDETRDWDQTLSSTGRDVIEFIRRHLNPVTEEST